MKKKLVLFLMVPTGLCGLAGCGGEDPLTMWSDPTVIPALTLPFTASIGMTTVAPYCPTTCTPTRDGFEFTLNSGYYTTQILVPGDGVVSDVSTVSSGGSTGYTITIYHNNKVSSRVTPVATSTYRVGDRVYRGQSLGSASNAFYTQIRFSVYVDGLAVCPSSFLDTASLQALTQTWSGYMNQICQP